ncbi:putative branched-chain amino acid transport system permease, membrane component [Mesorhizobium metallidurans STM 2683]|uniref:Putative branched-chain amino acid transport system permease, membrane component n=1 Tax=Mesorhizobium metallidurans STM 2683 TaxID=1297569 RepID=M5EQK5_9HYPH|nr:branched-chain amino acid ABC transporter permease [Mesorhizobium metallidurans]CCV06380.1 putative branched-chain amino acid transport system permease, membrane component [Mesorhizobium metallidurans STM 2683]
MFYRTARRLPDSYSAQLSIIGRNEDRIIAALTLLAVLTLPQFASPYFLKALLIPFLILSIAAIGLNLLMGYAGQPSLGSGAFMAVGAYTAYKLATNVPEIPIVVDFAIAGVMAAGVGIVFGLPSLRMRAFYLAIATLAIQFFIEWLFSKVAWFWNDHPSGVVSIPQFSVFGIPIDTPQKEFYLIGIIVALMTILALNLTRSHIGRQWMAVRDNETAARLMGISVRRAKLSAFAISSFYCGVAGALWAFVYLKTLGITSYSIDVSFKIMFMIVIGGVGTIGGSFIGTAFVLLVPIFLSTVASALSLPISTGSIASMEQMIFGLLIVYFVIVEPQGIVRIVRNFHQKLVSWPLNVGR